MRTIHLAAFSFSSRNNHFWVGNRPVDGDSVGLNGMVPAPKVVVAAVNGECSKVDDANLDTLACACHHGSATLSMQLLVH